MEVFPAKFREVKMAHLTHRRPENVSGDFYVDSTCIDCDTCRWMAPDVFYDIDDQSAVYHQPTSPEQRLQAMQALLSCPTASIGTIEKPTDIKQAQDSIPIAITEKIYHCGYHAENSFGAASYLIQRPEGNVLVDSPRFTPPLVKRIEALGGIRYLYLTHRDDVADHQKYHDHFGCDRILHEDEINFGTKGVEIKLTGTEPYALTDDLLMIPVPGHTKGHTVLLYKNTFLFTGDHLAWSPDLGHLYAFRGACWYSWTELLRSMEKLAHYSFEWVLPGHGRRYHGDRATTQAQMQQCLAWMRTV
jgi:glyoxylase-like metal-dependent hydrolase (beta-lactamase superfamily II)/ferredoxin